MNREEVNNKIDQLLFFLSKRGSVNFNETYDYVFQDKYSNQSGKDSLKLYHDSSRIQNAMNSDGLLENIDDHNIRLSEKGHEIIEEFGSYTKYLENLELKRSKEEKFLDLNVEYLEKSIKEINNAADRSEKSAKRSKRAQIITWIIAIVSIIVNLVIAILL